MFDSLTEVIIQFVIMSIELKKSAKSGTKVFVQQDYHSPIRMDCTKTMDVESHIFIALEINKTVYILYIQYMYILQVCTSTSGIVICHIG